MKLRSLKKHFKLLITAFVINLSFYGAHASYENSTALGVGKKKSSIMLVNNISYGLTTDIADANSEKVYFQGLNYGGTLFFLDKYYATAGLGANYHTVDQSLIESDNGSFHISDLSIGLGTKGMSLIKKKKESLSLFTNINNILPLSERSRNEGYRSVSTLSGDLAYQRGPLGLVLSARGSYIFNSFETNIAGNTNPATSFATALTARYNWKRYRFQYSYRIGVRNFIDGSTMGSSGNSFSASTMLTKKIWAGIATSNVNYIDEQFVDVWFYDPYRRIYNFRLGVTF